METEIASGAGVGYDYSRAKHALNDGGLDDQITRPWAGLSWLPSYAPELNPVEQDWNHTKYSDLANYLPDTLGQLHEAVGFSLASEHYQPILLRSFFQYAKLKL